MLTVANVDFAIKVLVDDGGFVDAAARPRRPHPVLPAAVPRRRADLHRPGQRRAPACRSTSPSRSRPSRTTCARSSRRCSSPCRGSGRRSSPRSRSGWPRRRLAQAGQLPAVAAARRPGSGPTLVANGGTAHPLDPAALRRRLPVPASGPCASGSACGAAGTPGRGRRRSPPRCSSSSSGIGVPIHEVYGMTENTRRRHRQPSRPDQARHRRRAAPRRRAAHRRGDRRDPDPPRRRVRRLLGQARARPPRR